MAEEVKGKDLTENVQELAEAWYRGEFDLGYYNLRIFTTTEGLIQKCKSEHKIKVRRQEIENMCKLDLLEFILDKKDRKKMFPLFMADRVTFIKKLQKKFDYPTPRLQQIIAYENGILPYSSKACDFYYADRKNIYSWLIKRIRFEVENIEEYLKCLKILKDKYSENRNKEKYKTFTEELIKNTKETLSGLKTYCSYVSGRKWSNLTEDEKQAVKTAVFEQQVFDERQRIASMRHYYNKILSGYSPQVEFKEPLSDKETLHFESIDWDETINTVLEYSQFLDFFKTTYFSIEITGEEILIRITNPRKVSAPIMRNVEKIYTIMKDRIGYKRKAWGENSGRRHFIQKRDEEIRRLYANWRKTSPNTASYILLERLCKHTTEVGAPVLSTERLKRIIYSKNKE
jgi:hypothetical protein